MTMSGAVLVMLPIAIAACVAIILIAQRSGWLLHLGGRMATAALCYVILLVAVPPQFSASGQAAALLGGLTMFATAWALGVYRYAPKPAAGATFGAFHADYQFEEVDDDEGDDWVLEPVDVGAAAVGGGAVGVRDTERSAAGGGAGGASALRGASDPGAGDGAAGGSGVEGTDRNGGSAGTHRTDNGMVRRPSVAGGNRRRRGVRLAGALVPWPGAPGDSAGAGGYDAAGATAVASIAATGAGATSGATV